MGFIVSLLFFHKDDFGIKPTKVDWPLNKKKKKKNQTKPDQIELLVLASNIWNNLTVSRQYQYWKLSMCKSMNRIWN